MAKEKGPANRVGARETGKNQTPNTPDPQPNEAPRQEAEELLGERALAVFMGWQPATPRVYRCRGLGPPFRKRGRAVFYLRSDVVKWLQSAPLYRSTSEAAVAAGREAGR